jgi:hypothetical protein
VSVAPTMAPAIAPTVSARLKPLVSTVLISRIVRVFHCCPVGVELHVPRHTSLPRQFGFVLNHSHPE